MTLASRDLGKTVVTERHFGAGRAIAWPDVLGCLLRDETRSYAVVPDRGRGFLEVSR